MEKQKTYAILSDLLLDKILNEPIPSNTFLKSYYEGMIIVFPDTILLVSITGRLSIVMTMTKNCFAQFIEKFYKKNLWAEKS